MMSCIESGVVD